MCKRRGFEVDKPVDESKNSLRLKNDKLFIVTIILGSCAAIEALVLVTLLVLCCTGRVAMVAKSANTRMVQVYNVCNNDIVNQWNDIWKREDAADAKSNYNPIINVRLLAEKVKKLPNYEKDPTCQFIMFNSAIYSDDTNGIVASAEAIRALNDQGNAINGNMTYRQTVDSISKIAQSAKKHASKE